MKKAEVGVWIRICYLLSRCKSEVLKKELEDLKRISYIESERCKIKRFLVLHPEYSNVFEKD